MAKYIDVIQERVSHVIGVNFTALCVLSGSQCVIVYTWFHEFIHKIPYGWSAEQQMLESGAW